MTRQMVFIITVGMMLILALPHVSIAQSKKSDSEYDGLAGPVHVVRYEVAELKNKSGIQAEGKRKHSQTCTYDRAGRMIEKTEPAFSEITLQKTVYSYDTRGNRTENYYEGRRSRLAVDSMGRVLLFDGNLRVIARVPVASDGSWIGKWEFMYDGNGYRVEERAYWGDGSLRSKYVHSYDAGGKRTETAYHSAEGLRLRRTYTYDSAGNVSEMAEYKSNGSPSKRETYAYESDSTGNWIKRITSRMVTKKGQSQSEPFEVTYRAITYYWRLPL